MNKTTLTVLFSSILFLSACGSGGDNEETQAPVQESTNEADGANEESEVVEPEEEAPAEEDAGESENGLDYSNAAELLEGNAHPITFYEPVDDAYKTEDGTTIVDFDGFLVEFTTFLVDFKPSEEYLYDFEEKENVRALLVTTYAENTNEFDVDYNGGMTVVTDTKEQVSAEQGLMGSNPIIQTYYGPVAAEGYYIIPLKDDSKPNELTIIMDGPWKVENGAVNTETGQLGEEQRITLQASEE